MLPVGRVLHLRNLRASRAMHDDHYAVLVLKNT